MLAEHAVVAAVAMTTATAVTSLFGFDPYVVAFVGVPFTVVGMAATGAMLSFAFGTTEEGRLRLFGTALAATVIGAAAVTGVPEIFHMTPVSEGARPVVGFFYGLFARWGMPLIIDVAPTMIRHWLRIPPKTGNTP